MKTAAHIEKLRRKTKGREGKTKQPGQIRSPRLVAATKRWSWQPPRFVMSTTVKPWWSLSSLASSLLVCCVLLLPWTVGLCLGSFALGLLGLFCYLSWLGLASTSYFSPNSWSEILDLQSKLNNAKIECNRRNIYINRMIMQFNPKIEPKSFKILMHMWHLSIVFSLLFTNSLI